MEIPEGRRELMQCAGSVLVEEPAGSVLVEEPAAARAQRQVMSESSDGMSDTDSVWSDSSMDSVTDSDFLSSLTPSEVADLENTDSLDEDEETISPHPTTKMIIPEIHVIPPTPEIHVTPPACPPTCPTSPYVPIDDSPHFLQVPPRYSALSRKGSTRKRKSSPVSDTERRSSSSPDPEQDYPISPDVRITSPQVPNFRGSRGRKGRGDRTQPPEDSHLSGHVSIPVVIPSPDLDSKSSGTKSSHRGQESVAIPPEALTQQPQETRGKRRLSWAYGEASSSSTHPEKSHEYSDSDGDSQSGPEYGDGSDVRKNRGWWKRAEIRVQKWTKHLMCRVFDLSKYYINPQGTFIFFWTGLVSLCVIYNAIVIPLRFCFDIYSKSWQWMLADYLIADLVYILDVIFINTHINFKFSGITPEPTSLIRNYFCRQRKQSLLDVLCLLPLDLLYTVPGLHFSVLLRLPRLLKAHILLKLHYLLESHTNSPNVYRVFKLLMLFTYVIHIYTCVYYLISRLEGLGVNQWVYNGEGMAYLRCFYIGLLLVSNIHEQEERNATNTVEFVAEIVGYMLGVFTLAVIIGELRFIAENSNKHNRITKTHFEQLKIYMNHWKTPKRLQMRVQAWYEFALTQEQDLNERRVMKSLTWKMKSDLAIHVHLGTLRNVSLFKSCELSFLRELVLKLKPTLYLPGDYVVKKGDVGRVMYIVSKGILKVLGGSNGKEVLAELGPGSAFGEISLLDVGAGRRRTASVRSISFSNLFMLSKKDLDNTLLEYPDIREDFKEKARELLKNDARRRSSDEVVESPKPSTKKVGKFKAAFMTLRKRAKVGPVPQSGGGGGGKRGGKKEEQPTAHVLQTCDPKMEVEEVSTSSSDDDITILRSKATPNPFKSTLSPAQSAVKKTTPSPYRPSPPPDWQQANIPGLIP